MGEIRVNFGAVANGAAGIAANFRALQSSLESLEQQLQPMVSTWTGDAQAAYFTQKQKWDQASQAMAVILSQMGSAVDQAHSNYVAAENSNRSLWS